MLSTLFVVDDYAPFVGSGIHTISFDAYLQEYPKLNEPKVRVINLCDTSRYLSQGYYCSLLAEARSHQVLPSVKVINELRNDGVTLLLDEAVLPKKLLDADVEQSFVLCMGEPSDSRYRKLAGLIYPDLMAPLLFIVCSRDIAGLRVSVRRCSLNQLTDDQRSFCLDTLAKHAKKSWRSQTEGKKFRWDLAILVNPEEAVPPSNKGAISRFVKAGEKLGIRTRIITANDLGSLSQFDALFIRETTAIDHHTYRFAREAENLGLVVIDDPSAILRCCNKVFLHDAFSYQKVPGVPSQIISDTSEQSLSMLEESFPYPMVLKMPEGSFSKGVYKVASREELKKKAEDILRESALVLVQKYLYTEFDWRIGMLNGLALYACRYYMAKNHWQIYNHGSKRFFSGGFDALPTFEVPTQVLNAAMKAAAVVGNGLYGIDIKEDAGRAYVLEVNDNPSIDHGIEDAYLGEELYMQVMSEFLRRLEMRGR